MQLGGEEFEELGASQSEIYTGGKQQPNGSVEIETGFLLSLTAETKVEEELTHDK